MEVGDKGSCKTPETIYEGIQQAITYKPIYVNCHSGKDYFTSEQNCSIYRLYDTVSYPTASPFIMKRTGDDHCLRRTLRATTFEKTVD
jgi:hypothetical protein